MISFCAEIALLSVVALLNTRSVVLAGILAVVRSNKAQDRPYTGLTEIKSGEVAEDLAAYLADSEQANAALALGVSIKRDAAIRAAGGYLIQVEWRFWWFAQSS